MKWLFLLSLFVVSAPLAQARDYHPEVRSALAFLADAQLQQDDDDFYKGEWATYVTSISAPSLIGIGKWGHPYADPTAFGTASVTNLISDMYFNDPGLKEIPPMVENSAASFARYYVGALFNFYPPKILNGVLIHNPRQMKLSKLFTGFANIPPDADSTSITYLAMNNAQLIKSGLTERKPVMPVPPEVYSAFSNYRDLNRKPHFFNRLYGNFDTGAYMTWLVDEKDPSMPRSMAAPEKGPRIPFGVNDVDCIVNANVLKFLTMARHFQDPGFQESCDLMKRIIDKQQLGLCGLYYPNKYEAGFEFSRIREQGPSCLQDHEAAMLEYVLDNQRSDGSWINGPPSRNDIVQSTAMALNTLLLLGDSNNSSHRAKAERAVNYLLAHARKDEKGRLYWNGEVYFTAVAQARFSVVWRSTPYTTALVAKALLLAGKF